MTERPYVVLSCAISLDGCLDSAGPDRLVLSGAADLDRVDAERAAADAILVGAGTIRRDDPRLLIRSAQPAGRPAGPRAARAPDGRDDHRRAATWTRRPGSSPGRATRAGAARGGAAAGLRRRARP